MTIQNRTVQLPESLCAQAEKWMGHRFENIEALLVFVLREIVAEQASNLDEQEEQIVQQRLRDLGYM